MAIVDIMLKRYLRAADVIGGDEGGVIYIYGVVDDRVLLVVREQADHKIDHQQAERDGSELSTKSDRISVARPIGMRTAIGRSAFRSCVNVDNFHLVALP
jgi:hypothetical protein